MQNSSIDKKSGINKKENNIPNKEELELEKITERKKLQNKVFKKMIENLEKKKKD